MAKEVIEEVEIVDEKPAVNVQPEEFDPWAEDVEIVENVIEAEKPEIATIDPNVQKMSDAVAGLTSIVQQQVEDKAVKPVKNTKQPAAFKPLDLKGIKEKLDKGIFGDKPSDELIPLIKAMIYNEVAPTVRKQTETLKRVQTSLSKQNIDTEDTTVNFVMDKYADEVTAEAEANPTGDAYQNALNKVTLNHLSEVITAQATSIATDTANKPPVPQPTSASKGSVNTTRTPGRTRWVLTGKTKAEYDAQVARRDEGFVREMYIEQGWLVQE